MTLGADFCVLRRINTTYDFYFFIKRNGAWSQKRPRALFYIFSGKIFPSALWQPDADYKPVYKVRLSAVNLIAHFFKITPLDFVENARIVYYYIVCQNVILFGRKIDIFEPLRI